MASRRQLPRAPKEDNPTPAASSGTTDGTPEDSVQEKPEGVWLHTAECTESAEDYQRMRYLMVKNPTLLYTIQPPVPVTHTDQMILGFPARQPSSDPYPTTTETTPIWHACRAQHLTCVKLILKYGTEFETNQLLKNPTFRNENIIRYTDYYGTRDENKSFEIIKCLLEHGVSPNIETPIAEIQNTQLQEALKKFKTKSLFCHSPILDSAEYRGNSELFELLFKHGAYPEPMILTESGSLLPLYPTLLPLYPTLSCIKKKRVRLPIPVLSLEHGGVLPENIVSPLIFDYRGDLAAVKRIQYIKTTFMYGASVPPYGYIEDSDSNRRVCKIGPKVLYPFDVIFIITERHDRMQFCADHGFEGYFGEDDPAIVWGTKPDGTVYRYHEILLDMLKLYHQFGGSLWWKMRDIGVPCKGGKGKCLGHVRKRNNVRPCQDILMCLWESVKREPERSMLVEEVRRMMSTPHSLQHSARLAIRRSMGYGCMRNVDALPLLHNHLKKYLKFEIEV